ncbi:MAG: hypothetical protein HY831_05040 [Candidatus Aenigmarchaeota archaeon]|nr:hypothetical protein [Candidatus Aenigmarchaeota archaeon]
MEVDYLLAIGIFVAVFAFSIAFVSNNVLQEKETIKSDIIKEQAENLFNDISSGKNISLISPMYRLYIYAENKNSTSVKELITVDLNKYGSNDPYSVSIYDQNNNNYNYAVGTGQIMFSSQISGSSSKSFVLYYDDDSNFPTNSSNVQGNDTIKEQVYGPEKIYVVQNNLLNLLKNSNQTVDNFHIIITDIDGRHLLDYGPTINGRNVIVKRKPVVIQGNDKILYKGWLIVSFFD